MRQRLSKRKVRQLRERTGLDIQHVLVRGGTRHRRDLCLADGSVVHLHRTGELERTDLSWHVETDGEL